jgi:rhodanese-related sulfurtransferase
MPLRRNRTPIAARSLAVAGLGLTLVAAVLGQDVITVSPARALDLVKEPRTFLVDVRSVAEYVLVGHPEMAYNVPFTFWSDEEGRFVPNPDFLEDLAARFGKDDALVFICRSGGRSRVAAQAAREAGYSKVYNVAEGFEGSLDEKGYRTVGGWKNSLPYTYKVEPGLAYRKRQPVTKSPVPGR